MVLSNFSKFSEPNDENDSFSSDQSKSRDVHNVEYENTLASRFKTLCCSENFADVAFQTDNEVRARKRDRRKATHAFIPPPLKPNR